jgi:O-antigen/teichoic acid export membrane protein
MPPAWFDSVKTQFSQKHIRDIASVFAIQAVALMASLLISLLITNLLGAAAYGTFSYAFSWISLLATFSCLGFEQLALKEIPAYQSLGKREWMKGFFLFSMKRVVKVSVIASVVLFAGTYLFRQPADDGLRMGLWLAIPVLPAVAVLNLRFSWLRSKHQNVMSQLPDKVIRPMLFLLGLAAVVFFARDLLNIPFIIGLSGISIVAALLLGEIAVRKNVLSPLKGVSPVFEKTRWTQLAGALLAVNGLYFYLAQMPLLAIGTLRGAKETGVFAIASRLSDLEGYLLFAMNVVLAPMISKLYAEKNLPALQKIISGSLRFGFVFSLPLIAGFLFFPSYFLGLFGDEFGEGRTALILLTISQLINFATGSVGYLLTMTGHQKTALQLLIACAVITTALAWWLIPLLGINGAAIAAAANNVLLNVSMAVAVYRKTGINSTLIFFR